MSLNDTITELATGIYDGGYTITRTAQGAYDAATGDFVPGAVTSFTLVAVIHPAYDGAPAGARIVPPGQGRHTEETLLVMTATQLYVETAAQAADRLTYRGAEYEIVRVDGPWSLDGDTHWEAYAARLAVP